MGSVLSFVIELAVVILLGVTVTYCIILDRRLQKLRMDEKSMRQTVVDLGLATDRAERAIDSLKTTLVECDQTLGERLKRAEHTSGELVDSIRSGDEVLERIGKIVSSARKAVSDAESRLAPEPAPPAVKVSDTAAAAEAFALRARQRILSNAA